MDIHPAMVGFGKRLKKLRKDIRGLTQAQLAELSQVGQSNISNYEKEKRPGVPLSHAMLLADALKVPLQLLAYGMEWAEVSVPLSEDAPKKRGAKKSGL